MQAQPGGGAMLGGMLCGLAIAVVIGTVIGAILLRAACWLYNKFAGGSDSPGAVPDPSFGKAMGITFVASLVNMIASFVLGMVMQGQNAAGQPNLASQLMIAMISVPLSLLVLAGMVAAMLPTSFGKAILIALLYFVVALIVGVVIVVVFLVIAMIIGVGLKMGG